MISFERSTRRLSYIIRPSYFSNLISVLDHIDNLRVITPSIQSKDIDKYNTDWTKTFTGGSAVCFPTNPDEVSNIMRYCFANKIGVVPQGGNTGY